MMSMFGGSRARKCRPSGMAVSDSGIPGVETPGGITKSLHVTAGTMLCGAHAISANAPYCEKATSVAAVTGASEIGPFVASTVEATYKLAVPPPVSYTHLTLP